MSDKIREAEKSVTMARLLSEKVGVRDAKNRKEMREWLEDAQRNINFAIEQIEKVDELRDGWDDENEQ